MRRSLISSSLCLSFLVAGCQTAAKRPDAKGAPLPLASRVEGDHIESSARPDGGPLYFGFDEHVLPPSSLASLQEVARYMRDDKGTQLSIEGHCDELGSSEYNLALGQSRALAAKQYLVALGVDDERVKVLSYGEERPALSGTDDEARARNRRDEMTFFTSAEAGAALDDASASLDVLLAWSSWDAEGAR